MIFGVIALALVGCAAQGGTTDPQSEARSIFPNRWTIPSTAATERSPLPSTPEVLAKGKTVYSSQCEHCHGTTGRNDGPDSDSFYVNADLTDSYRIDINPDGVVFYKIWYGRGSPRTRMPGFRETLSKDDVWAVVAYVQTLRKRDR